MEDEVKQEGKPFRDALVSSVLFGVGFKAKDSTYLRKFNIGNKGGAVLGAAFALIPSLINDDDDDKTKMMTVGAMALAMTNKKKIKNVMANNTDAFAPMLKTIKKSNEKHKELKRWAIELDQREVEGEFGKGLMLKANKLKSMGKEGFDILLGKGYKKSKAHSVYNKEIGDTERSLDEFIRIGKKTPAEYYDYFRNRRNFENTVNKVNLESGLTTTVGYFSKIEKGKVKLDSNKFFDNNLNYVTEKIDFLDSLPISMRNKESLDMLAKEENYGFFKEALKQGKAQDNEVSYMDMVARHGAEFKKSLGDKSNKYLNKDGNFKYMDILADQKFSDNILMNNKGKIVDTTWFSGSNYLLDSVKAIDNATRSFFKSNPLQEAQQFPLSGFLGINDKMMKSIEGDKMKNFYVAKEDNIDLKRTLTLLDKQLNHYKLAGNERHRKREGYKNISQALYMMNEGSDVSFNAKIKNKRELTLATRALEHKRTSVAEALKKNGPILERSPLVGMSKEMDTAYKKFHLRFDDNENFEVIESIQDKATAVFQNNKMYTRKNYGFTEVKGDYMIDYNSKTKMLQAQKAGLYYSNKANKAGIYKDGDTMARTFNTDEFKSTLKNGGVSEAIKYVKNSDVNFIPGTTKGNPFNESENFIDGLFEGSKNAKTYLKSTNDGGPLKGEQVPILMDLITGKKKQHKVFYNKYLEEAKSTFNSVGVAYEEGLQEIMGQVENSNFMKNRIRSYHGGRSDAEIKNLRNQMEMFSTNEINQLFDEKLVKNEKIKNFINIKSSFEQTVDKYKLSKDFPTMKSLLNPKKTTIDRLGEQFRTEDMMADVVSNLFSKGEGFDDLAKVTKNKIDNNFFFNREVLANKNRNMPLSTMSPAITRKWGSDMSLRQMARDTTAMSNNMEMLGIKGMQSFENTLEILGVPTLDPEKAKKSASGYLGQMLTKRILPAYALMSTYSAANSLVDTVLPDDTPIFGQGLTSAAFKAMAGTRYAMQVAINGIGMGAVFRRMEEMFPNMTTDNGLLSPLQLSATNQELYGQLFEGDEIEVNKNRFWFSSGRQRFSGDELKEIRPHMLYLGQQRGKGIYRSKAERFLRGDFMPTRLAWTLVDPYMEERINEDTRPVAKSGQVFDNTPVVGGFLNATIGALIKPTKYFREDEWKAGEGLMLNPNWDGQDNTLKYIQYDTSSQMTQAFSRAYNDMKAITGMRGYLLGRGVDTLFGGDDPLKDKVKLEDINSGRTTYDKFDDLQLGGMFGLTEPLRRMISSPVNHKSISPLKNKSLPDWMPTNYFMNREYGNIYDELAFGEYVLPGETYEKINKLHSDEYGKYGIVDRVNILSKIAPHSKEFRRDMRIANANLPNYSAEEQEIVYKAISNAEKFKERDVSVNNKQKIDVENTQVTVKRQYSTLDFQGSDGKRYKLAGLSPDYMRNGNDNNMTAEINKLNSYLSKGNSFEGVVAKDKNSSVKSDNDGEYIEIYVPEFDSLETLKSNHYLRYSSGDRNILSEMTSRFTNSRKVNFNEKIWGSKDTYSRYYKENVLDTPFKDWETPYDSFIDPIFKSAENAQGLGMLLAVKGSTRMGDKGDPIMPLLTAAHVLKGKVFGPSTPDRIEREDEIKNRIEFAKYLDQDEEFRGNYNSSIYNMNGTESLSKMKSFLTRTEKRYLNDIANEINVDTRQKIYDTSSDRMKIVLGELWKRQANYNGGEYEQENIELETYNPEEIPQYHATNDVMYNDAKFRKDAGYDLATYEERMINLYGEKQLDEFSQNGDLTKYLERIMKYKRNYNQRVLSTIMGSDRVFFDKEYDYVSI